MPDERGIITGHFIAHWGVPRQIWPRTLPGIGQFAILEFPPGRERRTWRYATNGMSSYLQVHPGQRIRVRTEVYACARNSTPWVGDLLAAVATYPMDYTTYLAEGDTINVGQPIDRHGSPYRGILLATPGPPDQSTLGLVGGLSEKVLVHQVVAIFSSELEYAQCHGGGELWKQIAQVGEALVDESRQAVA